MVYPSLNLTDKTLNNDVCNLFSVFSFLILGITLANFPWIGCDSSLKWEVREVAKSNLYIYKFLQGFLSKLPFSLKESKVLDVSYYIYHMMSQTGLYSHRRWLGACNFGFR